MRRLLSLFACGGPWPETPLATPVPAGQGAVEPKDDGATAPSSADQPEGASGDVLLVVDATTPFSPNSLPTGRNSLQLTNPVVALTNRPELVDLLGGVGQPESSIWADASLGGEPSSGLQTTLDTDIGARISLCGASDTRGDGAMNHAMAVRLSPLDGMLAQVSSPLWVGQGAQGAVLKAHWRAGCTVAVKYLVTSAVDVPTAYQEALVAKMLAHPYLVQTFDHSICLLDDSACEWLTGAANGGSPRPSASGAAAPSPGCPATATTGATPAEAAAAAAAAADPVAQRGRLLSRNGAAEAAGASVASGVTAEGSADSFDLGDNAGRVGSFAVRMPEILKQLGACPGKYVVQIVSEWCDEGTLHHAIRRGVFRPSGTRSKTWALRALLRTAREVALGMCHLHSINIIHGDLKPGNVLLKSSRVDSRGFVAKVADFGLSRLCEQQQGYVTTCDCGTVAYMAGEYLENRLMMGSDVYSFGVLLWQMFTGKTPFAGHHEAQVAFGVMMGDLQLEWPAAMPPPLARLGQACCRHKPEERPTFKEVVVALAGMETQVRNHHASAKRRHQEQHRLLQQQRLLQHQQFLAAHAQAALAAGTGSSAGAGISTSAEQHSAARLLLPCPASGAYPVDAFQGGCAFSGPGGMAPGLLSAASLSLGHHVDPAAGPSCLTLRSVGTCALEGGRSESLELVSGLSPSMLLLSHGAARADTQPCLHLQHYGPPGAAQHPALGPLPGGGGGHHASGPVSAAAAAPGPHGYAAGGAPPPPHLRRHMLQETSASRLGGGMRASVASPPLPYDTAGCIALPAAAAPPAPWLPGGPTDGSATQAAAQQDPSRNSLEVTFGSQQVVPAAAASLAVYALDDDAGRGPGPLHPQQQAYPQGLHGAPTLHPAVAGPPPLPQTPPPPPAAQAPVSPGTVAAFFEQHVVPVSASARAQGLRGAPAGAYPQHPQHAEQLHPGFLPQPWLPSPMMGAMAPVPPCAHVRSATQAPAGPATPSAQSPMGGVFSPMGLGGYGGAGHVRPATSPTMLYSQLSAGSELAAQMGAVLFMPTTTDTSSVCGHPAMSSTLSYSSSFCPPAGPHDHAYGTAQAAAVGAVQGPAWGSRMSGSGALPAPPAGPYAAPPGPYPATGAAAAVAAPPPAPGPPGAPGAAAAAGRLGGGALALVPPSSLHSIRATSDAVHSRPVSVKESLSALGAADVADSAAARTASGARTVTLATGTDLDEDCGSPGSRASCNGTFLQRQGSIASSSNLAGGGTSTQPGSAAPRSALSRTGSACIGSASCGGGTPHTPWAAASGSLCFSAGGSVSGAGASSVQHTASMHNMGGYGGAASYGQLPSPGGAHAAGGGLGLPRSRSSRTAAQHAAMGTSASSNSSPRMSGPQVLVFSGGRRGSTGAAGYPRCGGPGALQQSAALAPAGPGCELRSAGSGALCPSPFRTGLPLATLREAVESGTLGGAD